MPDWLQNNLGLVITVSGSIIVAVIGGIFGLWAKNHSPKTPVPIQDIWGENRALRGDLRAIETRVTAVEKESHAVREAFEALWDYMGRLRWAWGQETEMPRLTATEKRKITAILEETELAEW